ncbi:MAG TPA: acetyltransferase [Usitatibacter sp.]|nr:acetyltransferase [Usitatibacter sp.]
MSVRYFDVFNGDADGICALHQLRLADPLDSILVTGLKHDIALLERVAAREGDVVTVLDLSLDRNRAGLASLLERGVHVRYFDHHYAGDIPVDDDLEPVIDTAGGWCTSALVDRHLDGRFRAWAVVGAFGDHLDALAARLGASIGLDAAALDALRNLGHTINYNAYGVSEADVAIPPVAAYRLVHAYADPFELIAREPLLQGIARQRRVDLENAFAIPALRRNASCDVYLLPDAPWGRRVSGELANRLILAEPHRAHMVVVPVNAGEYGASVRSPRGRKPAAVDFCRRFETGGGRGEAAGIERVGRAELPRFLDAFTAAWSTETARAAAALHH